VAPAAPQAAGPQRACGQRPGDLNHPGTGDRRLRRADAVSSATAPASLRRPTLSSNPLDRIAVALDTPDRDTFDRWCALFGPRVGLLKVGLEAFARWGPPAVTAARAHGDGVFLDLKLHDIPNTVAGAMAAVRELGVRFVTVHATGGAAMLRAAVDVAGDRVGVLAVTLLTHLGDQDLAALDLPGSLGERAARWALLARAAGCAGVVCSPREAAALRAQMPAPFLLVTPGVRPAGIATNDQRRVAAPAEAFAAGADYLVVGRALTAAADPQAALDRLADELASAG
jgi:orotidine-5'-phosphate decarboxylase